MFVASYIQKNGNEKKRMYVSLNGEQKYPFFHFFHFAEWHYSEKYLHTGTLNSAKLLFDQDYIVLVNIVNDESTRVTFPLDDNAHHVTTRQ